MESRTSRSYRLPIPDPQIFNSPRENTLYNVVASNPDMLGFLVAARGERERTTDDYLAAFERLAKMQEELFRMAEAGERHDADVRALSTIAERPDSAFFLSSIAERVNPAAADYMQRVGFPRRVAEINRISGQAAEAFSAAGLRPPMGSQLDNFGLPIAPRIQGVPTSVLAASSGGREPRETTRYDQLGNVLYTELAGPPGTTAAARLNEAPLRGGPQPSPPQQRARVSEADVRAAANSRNPTQAASVARQVISAPENTPDAVMAAAIRYLYYSRMQPDQATIVRDNNNRYFLRGVVDGVERSFRLPGG